MRLLFPVVLAIASTASARPAADLVRSPTPGNFQAADCPSVTSRFAGRGSSWRRDPLKPQKLTELPPADTYAAVYRRDERGCIVSVMYPGTRARQR